jgi:hypothetical protein
MICPNCGSPNASNARFCGECGHDLAAVPVQPAAGATKNRRNLTLPLLGCGTLGLLLVCGASVAALFLLRSDTGLLPRQFSGGTETSGLVLVTEAPLFVTELPLPTSQPLPTATAEPTPEPQPTIYWAELEHNVPYEGDSYLVVHIEFEVLQQHATQVEVVARIWTAAGTPMEVFDPAYSVTGQAGTADTGAVEYAPSSYWEDYQLWIPYSAIGVGDEHYITVDILDLESGRLLESYETETFDAYE